MARSEDMTNELRVAVIGAGLGGIATAVKLKQAGFGAFRVFEQSDGPGGTWWDNTYPGCEVDVPSRAYSYAFMQDYDWTRSFAGQPEIQRYLEHVIDRFGVRAHFRFGARVERVDWNDAADAYDVRLADGHVESFNLVVAAVGMFSVPRYPEWPGLDDFGGPKFHTARWEHEHELAGKRVAVVGTGSTGAQVVPALASSVKELLVFQREPGWVVPKGARDYTERERARYRRWPLLGRWERFAYNVEEHRLEVKGFIVGSKLNRKMHRLSADFLDESVADPQLRERLTPRYPFGCKRIVISSDFYEALSRPNVTLVPHAVERVTPTGLVTADGSQHEADVLVMSTGFRPYAALEQLSITGPGGVTLQDVWAGDPRAFAGVTVAGIPNFFIMYGPNTNGPPVNGLVDLQSDVFIRVAKRMRERGVRVIDTPDAWMTRWVDWVDRRNRRSQSAGFSGCRNYYFSPVGRNVTQWPSSWLQYAAATKAASRLIERRVGA